MIGKPPKDRTAWDRADEFCWYMETMHPDEEIRRQFRLANENGQDVIELWSIRWGYDSDKLLGVYEVVAWIDHGGVNYVMLSEPGLDPPFGVYTYRLKSFSKKINLYDIKPELRLRLIELYAPEQSDDSGSSEAAGELQEEDYLDNDDIPEENFTPEECKARLADATEEFFSQFTGFDENTGFAILYTDDENSCPWQVKSMFENGTWPNKEIAPLFHEDNKSPYKLYMAVLDKEDTDELEELLDAGYDKCPHDFKIFGRYASEIVSGFHMAEDYSEKDTPEQQCDTCASRAARLCTRLVKRGYFSTEEEVCEYFETEYVPRMKAVCEPVETAFSRLEDIIREEPSEAGRNVMIYTDIVMPAASTEKLDMFQTRGPVTITLDKAEFCRSEIRVYMTFRNDGDAVLHLSSYKMRLMQDGQQIRPENTSDDFRPDDTVYNNAFTSGILIFPVKNPQKDFKLIVPKVFAGDDYKNRTDLSFEFDVKIGGAATCCEEVDDVERVSESITCQPETPASDDGGMEKAEEAFTADKYSAKLTEATEKFFDQFAGFDEDAGFAVLYTDDEDIYDPWDVKYVLGNKARSCKEIAPLFPEDDSNPHKLYMAVLNRKDTDELKELLDGGYDKCPHDFKIFGSYASEIVSGFHMAEDYREKDTPEQQWDTCASRAVQLCTRLVKCEYFSTEEEVCEYFETEYVPRMKAVCEPVETALSKLEDIIMNEHDDSKREDRIYTDIIMPVVSSKRFDISQTQHLITATLDKVEFCKSELRVHMIFRNDSDEVFHLNAYRTLIIQDGQQIAQEYSEYIPEPDNIIYAHASTSGILLFSVKDPKKDFRLIIPKLYVGDYRKNKMSFSFEFDVKIDEAIEQIAVDGDENICEVQTAGEDV